MDKKGRLFGKISIVDIIIIVAILCAAFAFAYKFLSNDSVVSINSDSKITAVLKVKSVRQYTVDALKVGDELYENHGSIIGKISEVNAEQAYDRVAQMDGTTVYGLIEGRYDVYVTVECEGRTTDTGYYINSNRLLVPGSDITIKNNKVLSSARVFSVEEAAE